MKKGFISTFQQGVLCGFSEVAKRLKQSAGQESDFNIETIFYTTAFQAGIDEFIISGWERDKGQPKSEFIRKRTKGISWKKIKHNYEVISSLFSNYLPDGWINKKEYSSIVSLQYFLIDLMSAMRTGSSLITANGIPDIAQVQAIFPPEIALPISNIFSSIEDMNTTSPIPQMFIPREDLQRFNNIIMSDLFSEYVSAQALLDDSKEPIHSSLSKIISTGRNLFLANPKILTLRKNILGVIQVTPKIVDNVFGKLPGALAELASNLGISILESRKRVVIYDLGFIFRDILLSLIRTNEISDECT